MIQSINQNIQKIIKKIKHHRIAKFDNNIDLRKIAILSQKSEFLIENFDDVK